MAETRKKIGGSRFVGGPKPVGFGMTFYAEDDGKIVGHVRLDENKQGPPGHAHGGSLITLIDEAMGAAAWHQGHRVLAVGLNFSLRKAVPLETEIEVSGWVTEVKGRKILAKGQITLSDGTVAVEGEGVFVTAPQYVGEGDEFNPFL